MKNWLIYGANGYTGRLIALHAKSLGLQPILAGRSADIRRMGEETGLPVRQFDLSNSIACAKALADVQLVLNCAGPFSATAAPMLQACLAAGAHYLDITGEYSVFEHAHSLHETAQTAGIVICPGVGFDVVPTDCLAVALKAAMPDAIELSLGFDTASGLSPGTSKTLLENLAAGGKVREQGVLRSVPTAYKKRICDFGYGPKWAMSIPWGDVVTAFYSTGIATISVYVPTPKPMIQLLRALDGLRPAFAWPWLQRLLNAVIGRWVKGPTAAQRATLRTAVWGEVRNAQGQIKTARIETNNGYELTAHSAVHVVQCVLANPPAGGYYTPAQMLGWQLVEQLPGSSKLYIS
ncbi:MAG: saccharopine dehydrogenase NADP-binding domain-containing protein [Pseudomonas sp.]|uniref:saccharopine dehydrogenase family protein n=1 Tax=Pseudomonas sp. TaxID=306 RepID=UPI00273651E0|nr:saccharopine dehydrogenase NADP-binding domain-containing protein [Pseudomonas sp.]MDP3847849.1 saccharopine dehydrogenase NADP-binding domain-containing protein [Pseudomonas sp.]